MAMARNGGAGLCWGDLTDLALATNFDALEDI